jgi:hypothetical protein
MAVQCNFRFIFRRIFLSNLPSSISSDFFRGQLSDPYKATGLMLEKMSKMVLDIFLRIEIKVDVN